MTQYKNPEGRLSPPMAAEASTAPAPTPAVATTAAIPPRPPTSKGRRYSKSEKQTILAEFVSGVTVKALEAKYGVRHETVNRWRRRAAQESAPTARPAPEQTGAGEMERAAEFSADHHDGYHPHWREVLTVWRSRPGLGPAQIKNQLHRQAIKITVATTRKIMEENGYTPPKPEIKEIEINRYEAVRPLELVHMDFKHFFINRQKVYLLLLQDDFSRYLCGHRMTDSENMKTVIEVFEECINRYGKMQTLMTDAGSAFYSWNGINRFQRLISEEYGIDQIKASTPRSNGKIENVNKQIEKELLDVKRFASLEEANEGVAQWIRFYNFERTHMGLPAGMVPADRFLPGWNQGREREPVVVAALTPRAADAATQAPPCTAPASVRDDASQAIWAEILRLALEKIKGAA